MGRHYPAGQLYAFYPKQVLIAKTQVTCLSKTSADSQNTSSRPRQCSHFLNASSRQLKVINLSAYYKLKQVDSRFWQACSNLLAASVRYVMRIKTWNSTVFTITTRDTLCFVNCVIMVKTHYKKNNTMTAVGKSRLRLLARMLGPKRKEVKYAWKKVTSGERWWSVLVVQQYYNFQFLVH